MLSKKDAILTIDNLIAETEDNDKKVKLYEYKDKIEEISNEQFCEICTRSLGENGDVGTLRKWITNKLEHQLVGTKFIKLNDMVSYNIAGGTKETIALHVVPKHVTKTDIRNMGPYLVDALEQLKDKIKKEELKDVKQVFAVSDILRSRLLKKGFEELGFTYSEGAREFKEHFKNPYQAELSVEKLLSDEWEEIKNAYVEKFEQNQKSDKKENEDR